MVPYSRQRLSVGLLSTCENSHYHKFRNNRREVARRLAMIDVLDATSAQTELERWQEFFRLSDWKMTVEILEEQGFEDASQVGRCVYDVNTREAQIQIVSEEIGDRIYSDPDISGFYSMEKTLLHEILHVLLAPLEADAEQIFLEQRVNLLTERFYSLKWCVPGILKADRGEMFTEGLGI